MKKMILFAALVFSMVRIQAQTPWQPFTMIEKVSVLVPVSLEKLDNDAMTVYMGSAGDSVNYSVSSLDFSTLGIDSALLQGMVDTEEFLEQYKTGFLSSMSSSTLLSTEKGKLGELTTILFEIDFLDDETGLRSKLSSYSVFSGSYVFNFNYAAAKPVAEDKKKFFSSVKVL